ncbi:MAG TPA: PASTA domain-containing protein, partial [Ktedonobacteraceae bacterium]
KYAHRRRPDKPPGPLRTFGGPLRLPCDVTYSADEETVMYIQRAKSVLVLRLIWRVLILFGLIISTFLFPSLALYIIMVIVVWLLMIGYTIVNYIDDVFILTTKRIIDIDRKFLFFTEEHIATEYGNIKDVSVEMSNPFFLALDVGTVTVQTPGDNPNIEISPADHPFSIQDMIYNLKGRKEKVDKIKAKNDRKNELNEWFSTVLATMESTVLGRGVPNLQKLDLFTAAERAREFGMKVVPVGEDPSYPNIAPGHIVSQNPIPGTMVQFESNDPEQRPQIRVVLSRRP